MAETDPPARFDPSERATATFVCAVAPAGILVAILHHRRPLARTGMLALGGALLLLATTWLRSGSRARPPTTPSGPAPRRRPLDVVLRWTAVALAAFRLGAAVASWW